MFAPNSPETLALLACSAVAFSALAARLAGPRGPRAAAARSNSGPSRRRRATSRASRIIRAGACALSLGLASASVAVGGGVGANMGFTYARTWKAAAEIVAGHQFGPQLAVTERPAPVYHGQTGLPPAPTGPEWRATFTRLSDGVQTTTFTGPISHVRQQVRVWLPANYDPARPHRVLFMLHGYPGNPAAIPRQLKLSETMPALAPDTIVVIPFLSVDQASPDGIDLAGRPRVGTWVVDDVAGLIRANFNVSNSREDWAIGGASYGGWLAATLGLLHPDRFGTIIAFSGYDKAETGALTRDPVLADKYSVTRLAAEAHWPQRIYATATAADAGASTLVGELRRTRNPKLDIATHVDAVGKHGWATWGRQLPAALTWWGTGETPHPGVQVHGASNAVPVGATVGFAVAAIAAGGVLVARGRRWGALRRGLTAGLTGVLGGLALLALFVAVHGMP